MKELFIETKSGRVPLDQEVIKKYDLNQGAKSPFTNSPIVGESGNSKLEVPLREKSISHDFNDMPLKGIEGDGFDQMENGFQMSQSEIIDFAQGTDSTVAGDY